MNMFFLRFILVGLLLSAGLPAQAHKVNMFAFAEGSEVFVEGYFSDGKRPMKCEVIVYDENNKPVLTGMTNDDGQFSFINPVSGNLRITLNAGEGHMAEYTLSAAETAVDDTLTVSEADQSSKPGDLESTVPSAVLSENGNIQAMIRQSVGQSLRPVMRALDELKSRRNMSDIIGGVGIIMGIGGFLLYVKARKLTEKRNAE